MKSGLFYLLRQVRGYGLTLEIIDAHVHTFPFIAGKRNEMINTGEWYGKLRRSPRGDWRPGGKRGLIQFAPPSFHPNYVSPEMLIEYMNWAGVDRAVLYQAPMYGNHNEYTADARRLYPGKFGASVGLASPLDGQKGLSDLQYIKDLGHVAVKLEMPDQPFSLDDERYDPWWRKIGELGLVCSVDLGWDPPANPYNFQISRLERIVSRYDNITFMVVHLGVSYLWDVSQKQPFPYLQQALKLKKYANVWFDLTGLQEFCENEKPPMNDYPFPRAQEIVRAAVEDAGSERLVWGTDFPGILIYCTYPQTLNLIRYHCDFLSDRDKELILGTNARKAYRFR